MAAASSKQRAGDAGRGANGSPSNASINVKKGAKVPLLKIAPVSRRETENLRFMGRGVPVERRETPVEGEEGGGKADRESAFAMPICKQGNRIRAVSWLRRILS